MATHDYVIDNQSAPALRSDLNNALMAIVSQNSNATAPTTTYANMIWYDTANNQIKKRNEANSAWISLGTVDETAGTFTPSGERALATQAQAEAGTDNTTLMTPLRAAQAIDALVTSATAGSNFGDVGTYAWCASNIYPSAIVAGSTYAGSTLRPAALLAAIYSDARTAFNAQSGYLSGTWRAMGGQPTPLADHSYNVTLFLRIS